MRGFIFLFLSFLVALQLQAQQDQGYSSETLDLFNLDSLEILKPIDTLSQRVDNYEEKLKGLKDELNTTIALPDTLLHHNPTNKINQNKGAAQKKTNAITDTLKQRLQVKVPDNSMNLVPKEAGLLPGVKVPELDIKPLEKIKGISEIDQLDPLKKIENVKNPVDLETIPELKQIDNITDKVKEVKAEAVSADKIGETVENKAVNLKGVRVLERTKRST